jgi:general nucleoside transport system permease protein
MNTLIYQPSSNSKFGKYKRILISIGISLIIGGLLTWLAGFSPISMVKTLFSAGFGCKEYSNCALFTTLQFATPLIFAGLSAAIAFRIGFFSIGQAGQMVWGAGFAALIGYKVFPPGYHQAYAIIVAAIAGAIWGILPVLLKDFLNIHEIISSFILNSIAGLAVGLLPLPWKNINPSAILNKLVPGSKLTIGIFLAIISSLFIYFLLWHLKAGYTQRMVGQAPKFARYGGIKPRAILYKAMMVSGALAGIGGAIEVLGNHYRFINSFSADVNFDGILVALLGQAHPIGVLFSGIFIGGIRLGSLNGLLIKEGIPRELGNTILAIMAILLTFQRFSNKNKVS